MSSPVRRPSSSPTRAHLTGTDRSDVAQFVCDGPNTSPVDTRQQYITRPTVQTGVSPPPPKPPRTAATTTLIRRHSLLDSHLHVTSASPPCIYILHREGTLPRPCSLPSPVSAVRKSTDDRRPSRCQIYGFRTLAR